MKDDLLDKRLAGLSEAIPALGDDFARGVRERAASTRALGGNWSSLGAAIGIRAAPALFVLAIGILAGGLVEGRTETPDALAVFETGTDHLLQGQLFGKGEVS